MSKQVCKVECNDKGEVISVTVVEEVKNKKSKTKGKDTPKGDENSPEDEEGE